MSQRNLSVERRMGDWMRARLPWGIAEFVMFGLKQGWACLFGGLFLIVLIASAMIWNDEWTIKRYDALFIFAVVTQAGFLFFKLESWAEAKVIVLFHIVGTVTGTWLYANQSQFEMVRWAKLGSWYLLLYISFLLVTLVFRDALMRGDYRPDAPAKGDR